MKVYIVMQCVWGEGGYPIEVYTSREKAERRKDAINTILQDVVDYAEVVELELDKGVIE